MNPIRLLLVACMAGVLVFGATAADADVIGYWKLDSNLNDSSGNAFTGTYSGTPGAPTYLAGLLDDAMAFTPSERMQTADSPVWDTGSALTISHWFNTTTEQSGMGVTGHDQSQYKYMTYLSASSRSTASYVRLSDGSTPSVWYSVTSPNTFADGQWHHLVVTYDQFATDGRRLKLYFDGTLSGTSAAKNLPLMDGDEGFQINKLWGTGYTGALDEVAAFDHALTQAEVDYIYNAGAGRSLGQTVSWNAAAGNWTEAAKWNPQHEPYAMDIAQVANGGTVTLSDDQRCDKLTVKDGIAEITGGSLTGMTEYWGLALADSGGGTAELRQSGGTVSMSNRLMVGGSGGTATYTLSDGSLTVPSTCYIGSSGTGEFVQTGGTVNLNSTVYMGVWSTAGHGTYRISDGTLNARYLMVSHNGPAEVYQTGGEVNVATDVLLGYGNTGTGSGLYEISAGSLDINGSLIVGRNAPGTFHIIGDGATIEVDGYKQTAASTLELDINGISAMNVDGAVTLAGLLDIEFLATPDYGEWFPIIINDGTDAVNGFFTDMPEGAMFRVPGAPMQLTISYTANFDGGSIGNDVAIQAVPEPATLTLLGLGGLGALLRRRKHRKSHRSVASLLVLALLLAIPLGARADVIGYWKYDADMTDSSGGGFNGTFTDTSGTATAPTYNTGKLGQAVSFVPTERVDVADDPIWDTGSTVSVSHWFKVPVGEVINGAGFLRHDATYRYLTYLTSASKTLSFYTRQSDGAVRATSYAHPTGNFADDQWHLFTGVYDQFATDGRRIKLYLDGGLVSSATGANLPLGDGDEGLRMGMAWSPTYTGLLDEVAVFSHALSQAEVDYIYNGGAGQPLATNVVWQNTGTATWNSAANWSPTRVPYSIDNVFINNGGTATVGAADDAVCNYLRLGNGASDSGTIHMTGGSLTNKGTTTADTAFVGYSGDGLVQQSGGDAWFGRALMLGQNSTATGRYELSGADSTVFVRTTTYVGSHGSGEIIQTGGTFNASSDIYMGVWTTTADGRIEISNGTLNAGARLGVGWNGTGTVVQTGGTVNVARELGIGYLTTGRGLYEISGGTLHANGGLTVGKDGQGTFHIIGDDALITASSYLQKANSTLELDINGISAINVDGAVDLAGLLDIQFLATPNNGDWFPIILNDGTDTVNGIFAGLPEGTQFHVPGAPMPMWITYQANFDGGTVGNDVAIKATPEPTTLTLLGLGALGLLRRRRGH